MIEPHPNPTGAPQSTNTTATSPSGSTSGGPSRRGAAFWTPWLIAAGLAIVAIALSFQDRALNQEIHDEATIVTNLAGKAAPAQQVLEVLTSPRAERAMLTSGQAAQEPSGNAIYLPDLSGLIFEASNLKPLLQDKTYELWVIPANGKPPVPAGLFRPNTLGAASVLLPRLPVDVPAKAFGVTVENASGSNAPTSAYLLSGTVPSSQAENLR